jgi:hypothetical protein
VVKNAKDAVELLKNIAQPHYANYAGAGHSPTSGGKNAWSTATVFCSTFSKAAD